PQGSRGGDGGLDDSIPCTVDRTDDEVDYGDGEGSPAGRLDPNRPVPRITTSKQNKDMAEFQNRSKPSTMEKNFSAKNTKTESEGGTEEDTNEDDAPEPDGQESHGLTSSTKYLQAQTGGGVASDRPRRSKTRQIARPFGAARVRRSCERARMAPPPVRVIPPASSPVRGERGVRVRNTYVSTYRYTKTIRSVTKTPALTRTFPKLDYDTKPKHESKAREIGRAEETEMMGDGVEDRRTIELDVKTTR
ncbi:hypothetical protein THAOC_19289, partial [Thalassiosira oceanica]